MQKMKKTINIGAYTLEIFPEETRRQYEKMPPYAGNDVGQNFFRYLLPRASAQSLAFLEELGVVPEKLYLARPLTEPDEKGEVLFFCACRICAAVLAGGNTVPRQSEEAAGMSMVFLQDKRGFSQGLMSLPEPETELRFVIPLPFDAEFFKQF